MVSLDKQYQLQRGRGIFHFCGVGVGVGGYFPILRGGEGGHFPNPLICRQDD